MDLREDKKHLSAEGWPQKQLLVQHSLQHEGGYDSPVAADLAQPVVFLRAHGRGHFHEIIRVAGPELGQPPMACLSHFGLAPQIVKLKNQLRIRRTRLFCHISSVNWDRFCPRAIWRPCENRIGSAVTCRADGSPLARERPSRSGSRGLCLVCRREHFLREPLDR